MLLPLFLRNSLIFLIPTLITQIFSPIAELIISIGISTNETNVFLTYQFIVLFLPKYSFLFRLFF